MISKINSIYFSPTGATKRVTNAVSAKLGEILGFKICEIDITRQSDRQDSKAFGPGDFVVLGLPVYGGRIPFVTEGFVHSLKGENTLAVCLCVYGNRDFDDALIEMKNLLFDRGFNVLAAGAFIGEHSFTKNLGGGRPDEKDILIAENLAEEVAKKISAIIDGGSVGDFLVKGNEPYRERKAGEIYGPVANENCIFCGVCANLCPVDAIPEDSPNTTIEDKCLRCCACVKGCPKNARFFESPLMGNSVKWLESNFTSAKEPEIFI